MMQFAIKSIADLEQLSHAVKWQYFERLVAWIFEQNNYDVKAGEIIKTGSGKRQIDVVASKYGRIFLVECKKWRHKERKDALNSAVRKHLERCDLYSIAKNKEVMPLIVTLLDDDIEEINGVAIVPITKLNWFLNQI